MSESKKLKEILYDNWIENSGFAKQAEQKGEIMQRLEQLNLSNEEILDLEDDINWYAVNFAYEGFMAGLAVLAKLRKELEL